MTNPPTPQGVKLREALTPEQIREVNESLWAELDEIKDKTGYNEYREAHRGFGHWTLLGYLLNLKHRASPAAPEQGDAHHWPQQGATTRPSAPEAANPEQQVQAGEPKLLTKEPLPEWAVAERAKKDAALQACVEALETANQETKLYPEHEGRYAAAITQAQEALK